MLTKTEQKFLDKFRNLYPEYVIFVSTEEPTFFVPAWHTFILIRKGRRHGAYGGDVWSIGGISGQERNRMRSLTDFGYKCFVFKSATEALQQCGQLHAMSSAEEDRLYADPVSQQSPAADDADTDNSPGQCT